LIPASLRWHHKRLPFLITYKRPGKTEFLSYSCRKIILHGKEINPLRLGDEKNASPQSELRHPRRVLIGVTRGRLKKLDEMQLPEKERAAYNAYFRHMMSISSRNHTIEIDAKEYQKGKRTWKRRGERGEEEQNEWRKWLQENHLSKHAVW
jgi:hypothetical protein